MTIPRPSYCKVHKVSQSLHKNTKMCETSIAKSTKTKMSSGTDQKVLKFCNLVG